MMDIVGSGAFFLTTALIFSLITLGLNLQWGLTGLFNVGLAGFVAIGAYTSALLTTPDTVGRLVVTQSQGTPIIPHGQNNLRVRCIAIFHRLAPRIQERVWPLPGNIIAPLGRFAGADDSLTSGEAT